MLRLLESPSAGAVLVLAFLGIVAEMDQALAGQVKTDMLLVAEHALLQHCAPIQACSHVVCA